MNRLLGVVLGLLAALLIPFSASAQLTPVPDTSSTPYGYYEYLPFGYDDAVTEEWPVVIFLHGIGEVGNGTTQLPDVLVTGLPQNINGGTQYPFVGIIPQSTVTSWNVSNLDAMVQYVKSNYHVNEDRIYLTGLSMGGIGTWNYGSNHPEELAAIWPQCAAPSGTPNGAALVHVPTWAFTTWGDTQSGANPAYTVNWVNSIAAELGGGPLITNYPGTYTGPPGPGQTSDKDRTASFIDATDTWIWLDGVAYEEGAHPIITLYKDTSHNCWSRTYNHATPMKWLLAQNRYGAANKAPTVTITAPANNATFNNPTSITITAQVADSDGTIARVEFYAGNQLLGTDNSSPHQLVWSNPPAGTHWITVKAIDNDNAVGAALVKITVIDGTDEIITPVAAGAAQGSLYFPMNFAFDGQPTGLDVSGTPTGGVNGNDAPYYWDRVGYIDFGANWQKVRISATWTKYRVSSVGNQTPYAALWWDDDIDTVNDSGLTETNVNFNSAQNLNTGSTEPWLRDRDLSANPVTPKARYLLCRSHAAMTNRAKEYAFVGTIVP